MAESCSSAVHPNGSIVITDLKQQTIKRQYDTMAGTQSSEIDVHLKNKQKVFPIFQQRDASAYSQFHWLSSLGPQQTCFHGVHLDPKITPKLAIFDLDGTIIGSPFAKKSSKDTRPKELQWSWWHGQVIPTLKRLHDDGYSVVIASNQNLKPQLLTTWRKKIPSIAAAIPDIPFRILAATAKDAYRKPMPGMWYELTKIAKSEGVEISKDECFFVGDAAGRVRDHAATDRKWAMNLNLKFLTPEEYFLNLKATPYKMTGFDPNTLLKEDHIAHSSLIHEMKELSKTPSVILFVGLPTIGKTTFFKQYLETASYRRICPLEAGGRVRSLRALNDYIDQSLSVVIDDTNEDIATRKHYLDWLKNKGIPIRCFFFEGSADLAWHNNLYRAFCKPLILEGGKQQKLLPLSEISKVKGNLVKPSLSEGFVEIKKIPFVFQGDTNERELWSMRLQIDGK